MDNKISVKMCLSCQKAGTHPLTFCPFCGRILKWVILNSKEYKEKIYPILCATSQEIKDKKLFVRHIGVYRYVEDRKLPLDFYKDEGLYDRIFCECGEAIHERNMGDIVKCPSCDRQYKQHQSPQYYQLIKPNSEE